MLIRQTPKERKKEIERIKELIPRRGYQPTEKEAYENYMRYKSEKTGESVDALKRRTQYREERDPIVRPPPQEKTSERKEKKKSGGGRRVLNAVQGTAREISGIGGMLGLKIRGGGVQGTLHGGERAPKQEWDFLYEGMPAMKRKRQQQQRREFDILWG
jgi:NTP pyrophosphatase (non-canonical NTP hydrolase)